MKEKIEKYLYQHSSCKITDIMTEFLLSYKKIMDILSDLYKEKKVKQVGDNFIKFCGTVKTEAEENQEEIDEELNSDEDDIIDIDLDDLLKKLSPNENEDEEDENEQLLTDEYDESDVSPLQDSDANEEGDNSHQNKDDESSLTVEEIEEIEKKEEEIIKNLVTQKYQFNSMTKFEEQCENVIEAIVKISSKYTRQNAIAFIERILKVYGHALDESVIKVLERTAHEFKICSDCEYVRLRNVLFDQ